MSALEPRQPYSDSEIATLYPPQLRLQLVQVFFRHGERTPVNSRFANTGLTPFWPYCSSLGHFRSAVLDPAAGDSPGTFSTFEWKRRLETFGPNDVSIPAAGPRGELDGICDYGMLTDRGRETTLDLGKRLRRLYVDKLGFLPSTIDNTDFLYLRSTLVPRALESTQQVFHGLYPPNTRDPKLPPPIMITRAFSDETLFPNDTGCRRFSALARAFAQRAADQWNDSPEMAYLNKKLGKWMPPDSPRVAVDSRPRLSGVMDTINATHAHGPETKLPKEFYDPKAREIIDKISVEEWFAGYGESREYRTLGIGGLLGDVVARMVSSAEQTTADGIQRPSRPNTTPLKLGLSGCHDTTLAAVLVSLGAFGKESWPPFTSHIAVELFRYADQQPNIQAAGEQNTYSPTSSPSWRPSFLGGVKAGTSPPGINRKPIDKLSSEEKQRLHGYYVRLRYNDRPVTIPGCKVPGKHLEGNESFCTLEAFKSIVDKFTPQDWKQQCRVDIKAPAFPPKPEVAGY